jgi:Sec-independent protein translocase protein TatA
MRGIGKGVGEFQAGLTQGKRALKTAMDEAASEEEGKVEENKAV